MYKPAMYVAVSHFTNEASRTKALTLIRLAVNLGIVSGPMIAGLLIRKNNYDMLFWIDGLTCVIAISAFMLLIDESKIYKARKKVLRKKKEKEIIKNSNLQDSNFILFLFASFITAFLFFQLFTTIPMYNTQKLNLSEFQIGMLLSLNGLLIFLFEMPLIDYLEKKKYVATKIILVGSVFMTTGFFCLLISKSIGIIALSISFITLGQILLFSFSNTFAFTRAMSGHEGKYMALYTMSFSAAQITSPKIGLTVIDSFSYFSNWLLMGVVGLIGISLYYLLDKKVKMETIQKNIS
jgi:MFS family permease